MKLRRTLSGFVGLVAIVLAVAWLSGWFEEKIPPDQVPLPAPGIPANATTVAVERVSEAALEWASGTIESARRTTIAARILARIEEVAVTAGDEVAQGDLLLSLDARDLEARLHQAREALKAAEAKRDLSQRELTRADELLKRGVTTRQRYDQALSQFRVAEAEVDRLAQGVTEAETALSHTEVRAPVAGRIIDRLAEPGDTAIPGQALLRLYDPTALRVEAPVRETLAVDLRVGDSLTAEISALQESFVVSIDEIVPYADPGARTLLVKVRLPSDARLFAGMFARVAIPAGERLRLLIPAQAIERIGQLLFVSVVDGEGRIERRLVTVGEGVPDGRIEVLSGLSEGEKVLLTNQP